MEESEFKYVKRTQKDYSMSFKLSVVSEIERGYISKTGAKNKYGIQGHGTIQRWLKNMVPLIGKIKCQIICQRVRIKQFLS